MRKKTARPPRARRFSFLGGVDESEPLLEADERDVAPRVRTALGVPELAGLATYAEAARIGYSVDENVRRLLRYQWTERRLMIDLLAHLTAEPVWEVKCGYALHQWQDAEHVDRLRRRIGEMRHPVPPLDRAPDDALDALLEEALRSADAVELLAGSYGVVRAALAEAYREHLAASNPLVDHPTRRVILSALEDHEHALPAPERIRRGTGRARRADRGRSGRARARGRVAGPPRGVPRCRRRDRRARTGRRRPPAAAPAGEGVVRSRFPPPARRAVRRPPRLRVPAPRGVQRPPRPRR